MPANSDITTNVVYTVAMIFFTLSLIAERLANIFKLWIPDFRLKKTDKNAEKKRELYVMIVALFFGIIVAIIAGANFFSLIHGDGLTAFETADRPLYPLNEWQKISGMFLSGVFISLGSKFWHDMLDIVLQFSNLKKSLAEQASANSDAAGTNALVAKMKLLEPQLQKMRGYSGYELNAGTGQLSLKFDSGSMPNANEKTLISNSLGQDAFIIVASNINLQHNGG